MKETAVRHTQNQIIINKKKLYKTTVEALEGPGGRIKLINKIPFRCVHINNNNKKKMKNTYGI